MTRTAALQLLGIRDHQQVLELMARNPVVNCFVASRVEMASARPWRSATQLWGFVVDGSITAVCHAGANLVPAEADADAIAAFADRARRQGRRCSSIVGPSDQVALLWAHLSPYWTDVREVRADQPLMTTSTEPAIAADPGVRRVRREELDILMPACIAMFIEEVGTSPLTHDGGASYRARVAELIESGRSFARIEGGRVMFKAEIGAVSSRACQVQGVWVDPDLRGQGLAAPGMAAVVEMALRDLVPAVSLYVNDFNIPARRAYERVGFRQVGTFTSILF